ncbi:MAG: flagellar hook-length control protein FliK [Candidatus Acidiferrales bacterium]
MPTMLPMLNFASLPKTSPEVVSNSPANHFGISSPPATGAPPFSSVLSRAWAAQSSVRNNQTGEHPNPAQRPQPGGMDSANPFQPPASNPAGVYSPVLANPPATSALPPSAAPLQTALPLSAPTDSGANPSSPSPLKSVFLDAASAAASIFGFPGKLAMAAASGIAGALEGSSTTKAPGGSAAQNAAPAAAGQAASGATGSTAPGDAVDTGAAANEIAALLASDQQSSGTAAPNAALADALQPPTNAAATAPAAQVPHLPASADVMIPMAPKLIMPQADLTLANAGPASNQNISAQAAANSPAAVGADAQKSVSDSRQSIVSQISSHLQSVLDGASAKAVQMPAGSAGASAAPGNSSGNSSSGSSSNSSNAGSQNGSQDAAAASAGTAASDAIKITAQPDAKDSAISSAAATTAAGMAAMAASTSAHAAANSSCASAGNSNSPAEAALANNARASSLPPPLPASLPASLQDVVNASALYQRMGGADMHINMQMDLLGAVDLHASIHQGALTATIGVQHSDVQALLSNDLPILQHALAEQNLHVEQISVLDHSAGGRMDLGGNAQQQPQQQTLPGAVQRLVRDVGYAGNGNSAIAAAQAQGPRASQGRLSILA